MLRQLFDNVNGKYQKSKKMQLIQTIWDVMALLTELDFLLETTCCCKRDRKERYWGQQFWQMARDRQRPVTVDHLQSWSQIFRSDQTEMVRSIWWTNRNFRTFGSNAKRPGFPNHSTLINDCQILDIRRSPRKRSSENALERPGSASLKSTQWTSPRKKVKTASSS